MALTPCPSPNPAVARGAVVFPPPPQAALGSCGVTVDPAQSGPSYLLADSACQVVIVPRWGMGSQGVLGLYSTGEGLVLGAV